MPQSKLGSFTEAGLNILVGVVVAVIANWTLINLLGYPISLLDATILGGFFTIISLIRGYYVRRFFNYLEHKGWFQ